MSEKHKQHCPNCGTEFNDDYNYCPTCGQENKPLHLDFKLFAKDYFSVAFLIDTKIFQTLKLLLFKPAELTKAFLEGKRMSYLPPIRLYLVVSLIYFTILAIPHFSNDDDTEEEYFYTEDAELDRQDEIKDSLALDSLIRVTENRDDVPLMDRFEILMLQKSEKVYTPEGQNAFVRNMRKYISTGLFLFIPVNALLLFILFRRRRPYYIQHLIFVLHLQTAIFLYFIFFNIINIFYDSAVFTLLRLLFGFVLGFIWFKRFYGYRGAKGLLLYSVYWFAFAILFALLFTVIAVISLLLV